MENRDAPFNVGDVVIGKCENLGVKGDGIFKFKGYVVIAKNTKVDEIYQLEILKVLKNLSFAKAIKIHKEDE